MAACKAVQSLPAGQAGENRVMIIPKPEKNNRSAQPPGLVAVSLCQLFLLAFVLEKNRIKQQKSVGRSDGTAGSNR